MAPKYHERKNLGQVFTPFVIVNKLLDEIPQSVMANPNTKFLDPSAGMGGFLIMLYERLMVSLSRVIPDKSRRHKHIIGKMLFAIEITRNNVSRMKKIFGDELHVHCGDALTTDLKKAFGIAHVDVIVGNPPFERPQKKDSPRTGGSTLWTEFVWKSLDEWLAQGGWFLMLLPPGWRKPADEKSRSFGLWDRMTKKSHIVDLKMYDEKESSSLFGKKVSIRFDLVVIHNISPKRQQKTTIHGTNGKVYTEVLSKFPFLPNTDMKYWNKVLEPTPSNRTLKVVYSASAYYSNNKNMSRTRTKEFAHPVVHAIHKDGSPVFLYTNSKNTKGGFGVPKLIFNRLGAWNKPLLDQTGKYGLSQDTFGVVLNSDAHGKSMVKFFTPETLKKWQADMTWATSKPSVFWKLFRFVRNNFYSQS